MTTMRRGFRRARADARVERAEVWGRIGWGNTRHAYRARAREGLREGMAIAA